MWDDPEKAQRILRERGRIKGTLDEYAALANGYQDARTLLALALEEGDEGERAEAERQLSEVAQRAESLRLQALLGEEEDGNDCYIELHAGAGGTESQDWTEMLLRMYSRWCERRNFAIETLSVSYGEEAGIKSLTLKVRGDYAYGWLRQENGVHRLVRISPFDSNARRHTSFCSVGIYPVLEESAHEDIEAKDLRVDTYRSSGAGGQHVNTTDSAVRITHLPSGIVVQCQSDRSQHRNRATAFAMLQSQLYARAKANQRAESQAARQKNPIGWGQQIRSYVLQPYRLVKDLRTGVEVGDAQGVLDGNIDPFLEGALANLAHQPLAH